MNLLFKNTKQLFFNKNNNLLRFNNLFISSQFKLFSTNNSSNLQQKQNIEIENNKKEKLKQLENCVNFVEISSTATQKYSNYLSIYNQTILDDKNLKKYKNVFINSLFSILQEFYFEGINKKENDNLLIERINSVLDCIEDLSLTKRYSFVGAVLMSDNQAVKFFDYLKINKVELNSNHIEYICRIAISTKNPTIVEPIVDMPDFINRRKNEQLDKLEWLWKFILDRKRHRGRDFGHFRFALNRIAHFYRCANTRLPRELSTILSRLDNNTLIFKKEKEERKLILELDYSSTSTTDDPPAATTISNVLPTIKEDNLTSTIPMMKNLTLLDVELNSSTGGPILADDDNNINTTTISSVSNTSNPSLLNITTNFNVSTQNLNETNKIISKDSTEHVEKQERSILTDGSDTSSQSIEERDDNEKIEGSKNNIPNVLENAKQVDDNTQKLPDKIPTRLLIYAVQRNSNYVEEDFGGANSVASTDKTNVEASKEDSGSKEDKKSLEKPKLRRKRDNFSDAMNKLNNPIATAQQQLQQTNSAISEVLAQQQQPQPINIPIPNAPNIIFTSDEGNVTLQRGQGFLSVETSMGQH
uniref:Uncharacterized protein n=1 Tax=Meloidogyne floridensis TaxID=298350 RepID=A0A915NX69_9BILA